MAVTEQNKKVYLASDGTEFLTLLMAKEYDKGIVFDSILGDNGITTSLELWNLVHDNLPLILTEFGLDIPAYLFNLPEPLPAEPEEITKASLERDIDAEDNWEDNETCCKAVPQAELKKVNPLYSN